MWLEEFFTSSTITETAAVIGMYDFILCMVVSVALGLFISFTYTIHTRYTKGFVVTLAIIPAIVAMAIMIVNGNIGTGIAVAGTFSLVRFRSVPGTAKEIGSIFLAMGAGLAMGVGYIGFAILFTVLMSMSILVLSKSKFGEGQLTERILTITIPEDLDYGGIFDDLFEQYTSHYMLNSVKTTNMGSLFKITYEINLKSEEVEKKLVDELRCRNGNLEIVIARQSNYGSEL
ncbi:MAG: DUF4956 domain-containing protein [Eubacteriales bacterium]